MKTITIYTPTYNRESLLNRVYQSLKNQTEKDFIWVVVDDGSTDNTRAYIENIAKIEKEFSIEYYYKKNQGVHTARDFAYSVCRTELIFGVDSDDWLFPHAVEIIKSKWEQYKVSNRVFAGLICPKHYSDGLKITSNFPESIEHCSFQDLVVRYRCTGDMLDIFCTKLIQGIPDAPVFEDEKLIGERYKIIQIPDEVHFILCDEQVMAVEYQENGYSSSAFDGMFNNPKGFREDYRQLIICGKYLKVRLKGYLGYISCSILLRDRAFVKGSPNPAITTILLPLGFMALLWLKKRKNRSNM